MPSITKLLAVTRSDIITGEVVEGSYPNYKVSTNSGVIKARSALVKDLAVGARVVITKSDDGLMIIGTGSLAVREPKEITITG